MIPTEMAPSLSTQLSFAHELGVNYSTTLNQVHLKCLCKHKVERMYFSQKVQNSVRTIYIYNWPDSQFALSCIYVKILV